MYIKNVCIIFDASLWEAEKYFQHLFLNTVSKNLISTAIQWTKTCGPWVMVNCNSNFLANKSTRCTILLSFFYFSSLHVSENYVPIIGRNYCYLCDTGICHTEWQTPVSHRYNSFSWWWAHGCLEHVEKRNKYTKQNCAPSWIYLQDCDNVSINSACNEIFFGKSLYRKSEHTKCVSNKCFLLKFVAFKTLCKTARKAKNENMAHGFRMLDN